MDADDLAAGCGPLTRARADRADLVSQLDLLFGLIPFDYDDLCVERLDPGVGFLERSKMLSARVWEHERTLEPLDGGGTRVTDRVRFEPRVRVAGRVHRSSPRSSATATGGCGGTSRSARRSARACRGRGPPR